MEKIAELEWSGRWRRLVEDRDAWAGAHADPGYWNRRAKSFARSTHARRDELLDVIAPYLSPRTTVIDAGAGTGRHAVALAARVEWVTAVEPSDGMRAQMEPRDNMTIVACTWEDAEVAPADIVICSHVLYGVADVVPFIAKLDRSARERVFVMLRESELPHPANVIRKKLNSEPGPRMPRFSDLFMLLMEMDIAPDVTFLRYPLITRYSGIDEAVGDCAAMLGENWDVSAGPPLLEELLRRDGDDLVFDGGITLSGVAHWQPRS